MQVAAIQAQYFPPRQESGVLRTLFEALFRHKGLFLIPFVGVIGLVAVVTFGAHRQYRSTMKFLLRNNRSESVITANRNLISTSQEITEDQINSEVEVLESEDVISAVADPEWTSLAEQERTLGRTHLHEAKLLAFRKAIHIEPARKSDVINVTFTADSPTEAAGALARFSTAYLGYRKRLSRPAGASRFFADETQRYEQTWQTADQKLVAFQQQNHLVSVPESEETISKEIAGDQQDLREYDANLAEIDRRIVESSRASGQVPARQATQQHTIANQGSADSIRTLLVQLQNRRTELLTRYAPTDRLVTEIDQQIADTSASLRAAISQKNTEDTTDVNPTWQQVSSGLISARIERGALQAHEQSLVRAIAVLQAQLSRLQDQDLQFNTLQQRVDQAHSNFELFSEKRDQAEIEDAMDEHNLVNVAVVQSPTMGLRPVFPKPLLNLALGVVTALFLAVGTVYLAETSRDTVASARELESLSPRPVLASVPLNSTTLEAPGTDDPGLRPSRAGRDPISITRIIPAIQSFRKATQG